MDPFRKKGGKFTPADIHHQNIARKSFENMPLFAALKSGGKLEEMVDIHHLSL